MKNFNNQLSKLAKLIQENQDGSLEGGFAILSISENVFVLGGEDTNNCKGGNCVKGCGENTVQGCGGSINAVPGCGAS
jgi:hypothetical protein